MDPLPHAARVFERPYSLIERRLAGRKDHFMGRELLASYAARWKLTRPPPSNQTGEAVRRYARYSWSCLHRAASRMSAGSHNQGKNRRGSKSF
jgi:hypothetical protein